MFGLSAVEILVVLVVALLVFGPKQLPRLAGRLGKALRELRQVSQEFKSGFEADLTRDEAPPVSMPASGSAKHHDDLKAAMVSTQTEPSEKLPQETPSVEETCSQVRVDAPLPASDSEVVCAEGLPESMIHRPDAGI